ncbi:Cd2+/Zn2+-exporting ATPase [bacterium A37T11]|nr:Cd2+/Zn2+-exporting ATPase [bacterium A37T11]
MAHQHDHDEDHEQNKNTRNWRLYGPALSSLLLLLIGIVLDNLVKPAFFDGYIRLAWYILAYIPVGWPVMREAGETIIKGDVFTEFTLMLVATIGAFFIKQYPEGVAVMLFYTIGELFQGAAVKQAKRSITALMDVRPESASVLREGKYSSVKPETVQIGETIQIKAGEKVPLDGTLLSEGSSFNTAALTGESKPRSIQKDEQVLAGMLNLEKVIELNVSKKFADSSLARILDMVQHATARKAKTELFIRHFARIYTPIVFFLAVALVAIPYFVVSDYVFSDWLYRGLVFLVVSCPCALVISIPLGYFGGIGAASKHGILFKGGNFLDLISKVNTVVMDKTGTLTQGVFKVQNIVTQGMDESSFMTVLAALESNSTHPIAKAVAAYQKDSESEIIKASETEEIAGHGLQGKVNGKSVLAGNTKLLKKFGVPYDAVLETIPESIVVVAIDQQYAGYVLVADELKPDAGDAVAALKQAGVKDTIMLSGDKNAITQQIATQLGIGQAYGDLLPEQKVERVEELKKDQGRVIAFVGDGINDAPVLALSDVGIAMGAMGSDAAIETADVVIQTDRPSRIATAIQIGRATRRIVFQNVGLAFAVKAAVLILGAGGLATMWEAVFADVGVAMLAILNAVRIQRMKF